MKDFVMKDFVMSDFVMKDFSMSDFVMKDFSINDFLAVCTFTAQTVRTVTY